MRFEQASTTETQVPRFLCNTHYNEGDKKRAVGITELGSWASTGDMCSVNTGGAM